jgi:hypothetical protein
MQVRLIPKIAELGRVNADSRPSTRAAIHIDRDYGFSPQNPALSKSATWQSIMGDAIS